METGKLRIKDLVTIGVFTVIYFVLMFLSGMIGMVPILYLAYPTVSGIITDIVIMLFMAKVQKPWGLFILGLLTNISQQNLSYSTGRATTSKHWKQIIAYPTCVMIKTITGSSCR